MKLSDTLREYAEWADGEIWNVPITLPDVLREAADLLEKHVPPCSIGDTVYCIRNKANPKVVRGTVSRMYYGDNMQLGVMAYGCGGGIVGKNIFLTKEDAEKALKARTRSG